MMEDLPEVDVLMGHYLADVRLDELEEKATLPLVQTEYAHSLGLGFGEFERKWARILRTPGFAGGSIWNWMDGAAVTPSPKDPWLKGVMLDSLHYLDSYGYVRPEGAPERFKEANDGIVYAEGTPQEDYWLVRKLYSPVQIVEDSLDLSLRLTVRNMYDFRSLSGYRLDWSLKNLRRSVACGSVALSASSKEDELVEIPAGSIGAVPYSDLMLSVSVADESGESVYSRTLPVDMGEKPYRETVLTAAGGSEISVDVTPKGNLVIVDGRSGKTLMDSPLYLRVGRRFSQVLESRTRTDMFCWEPYVLKPEVRSRRVRRTQEGRETRLVCRWNRINGEGHVSGPVTVLVRDNGAVSIDYSLTASDDAAGKLTECGLTLMAGSGFDVFNWLGLGLYSSVPGKSRHNERGVWSLHRDDYRFPGNRSGVELSLLSSAGGDGIVVRDEKGDICVDVMDGRMVISQNAHVSGYGSKFTDPSGMLSPRDMKGLEGGFVLLARGADSLKETVAGIFFEEGGGLPCTVPVIPFLAGYAW